jgi:hypothetical protein
VSACSIKAELANDKAFFERYLAGTSSNAAQTSGGAGAAHGAETKK